MRGILHKKSSRAIFGQTRFFLTHGAYLLYYENENAAIAAVASNTTHGEPLAALDVRHMNAVEFEPPCNIRVSLSGTARGYVLQAASDVEAKEWVDNLIKRRKAILAALKEFEGGRERTEGSIDVKDRTLTAKTLATITDDELMALSSIKQHFLRDGYKEIDSALCLRYLRARKGKVDAAIEFLKQHLEWRRSTFPIEYDEIKDELAKGKFVLRGLDRDGDIIIYIRACLLGPDTYTSLENHMRQVYYLLERVKAEVLKDPMDKFCIIYDRDDVDKVKSDTDWTKAIAKALGDQYPESMKRCIVYPSNRVFRYIWNIVKVFFDPVTAKKIVMIGRKEDMYQYVEKDQLLRICGGTDDYQFHLDHVHNMEMISEEMKGLERVAPAPQTVY